SANEGKVEYWPKTKWPERNPHGPSAKLQFPIKLRLDAGCGRRSRSSRIDATWDRTTWGRLNVDSDISLLRARRGFLHGLVLYRVLDRNRTRGPRRNIRRQLTTTFQRQIDQVLLAFLRFAATN